MVQAVRNLFLCAAALAAIAGGCAPAAPPLPASISEYEKVQKTNPQAYSTHVILLHNMQRVLDVELPSGERVSSFGLVAVLGEEDPNVRKQVAAVLADPKAPLELQQAVLAFLLKKDYPDLASYVVAAMPNLSRSTALHDSVLEWLTKHPTPEVQAEVVKLWAAEPSASGPNESRYRLILQQITGMTWDEALLEELNTPAFPASGSAIGVLTMRLGLPLLRKSLLEMTARTDDASAIQAFLTKFDYVPAGEVEHAAVMQAWRTHRDQIDGAAKLAATWREDFGYKFNIRDFHLISQLAADPVQKALRRSQLIADLQQTFSGRQHAPWKAPRGATTSDDRLWTQADKLSMADLWNLYLLDDLLSRPQRQVNIRVMALRDREDKSGAWGGLIFYRSGQAEATQYPSDPAAQDDLSFVPLPTGKRGDGTYDFALEQRSSLCRFICHFERPDNAGRAGPTADELREAKAGNYCGLILTSLGEDTFCAHYFNPQGIVISVGVFPLRK